ncbi:MAG: hypothetical protein GF308_18590 [Candidatus Heimdallarchaeota archaeon]|nr:hypothetical protein [Candidatus Heimdallarchaeota archaeon]
MEQDEPIETPYRSDELNLSRITPFHVYWEMLKINSWRFLAHHPICSRYRNHYFKIGPICLCVGCTSMYTGILLYFFLFFLAPSVFQENLYLITILPFFGFSMAILHYLIKSEKKIIKSYLRFSAGVSIGAYFGLIILTPKWWVRLVLFGLFAAGYSLYGIMRGEGANREKCLTCPLRNADPPCNPDWSTTMKLRKLDEIINNELAKYKTKQ